ncbi:hypothetical protein HMF3257_26055 [Spirosoma telluris]|uniref:Uncharacterized protein n=1 Tax=Spirosoma telluris TaxID=2183553 RepID=A0A327NMV8_9BACT|nr:hypothetical protein HMF3257_26055 [Spirosoma telluris]
MLGVYKYFIAPKPVINLKLPTSDTCYSDKPIKIIWDYRGYKGKVDLYFVSDVDPNKVIKKIGSKENNPNDETQYEWRVLDFKSLENKKGLIKIVGTTTAISESPFIIHSPNKLTLTIAPPPPLANLVLIPSFSNDGKNLEITAIDTITNAEVNGVIYVKNLPVGQTNKPISTVEINAETIQKPCSGANTITNDACTKNRTFIRLNTEEITVKAPHYFTSKCTPVQTVFLADSDPNCTCSKLKLDVILQLDQQFYKQRSINPVSPTTVQKFYLPRQNRNLQLSREALRNFNIPTINQ